MFNNSPVIPIKPNELDDDAIKHLLLKRGFNSFRIQGGYTARNTDGKDDRLVVVANYYELLQDVQIDRRIKYPPGYETVTEYFKKCGFSFSQRQKIRLWLADIFGK